MTRLERLIAALVALSVTGNAAVQGGHLTPLDDPRLRPVARGTDAGLSDPRHFGTVPSRVMGGGRDAPSPYQQPFPYQITSAGKNDQPSPKGTHPSGSRQR